MTNILHTLTGWKLEHVCPSLGNKTNPSPSFFNLSQQDTQLSHDLLLVVCLSPQNVHPNIKHMTFLTCYKPLLVTNKLSQHLHVFRCHLFPTPPKKKPEVRDAIQSIRSRRPLGSAILRGQPAAPAAPVSSKVSQWDVTAPVATGATAGARPTLGTPYWSPEAEVPQVDAATWWKYCWGLLSMMDDGIRNFDSHRQLWTFFSFENTCNTKWGSEKARGLRCMGCQGETIQKSIMKITEPKKFNLVRFGIFSKKNQSQKRPRGGAILGGQPGGWHCCCQFACCNAWNSGVSTTTWQSPSLGYLKGGTLTDSETIPDSETTIQKLRFRNYFDRFRNYDSETILAGFRNYCRRIQKLFGPIQKLFRPIQKLFWTDSETIAEGFRNYFRTIQKPNSTDSETTIQKLCSTDSETILDRIRNYIRPIQTLWSTDSETIVDRFRNYCRPIQKIFSTDSETIFDRFRNYDSETIFERFRNYFRPIRKLVGTDWENTFNRFRHLDSDTIFEAFRNFFRPNETLRLASHVVKHFVFIYSLARLPFFLATYAFNDFPPPFAFLATHAFNDVFSINFSPPPSWQPMLSMTFFLSKISPPPSWQLMLSMIFFFSKFSPPLSWQPMLSMLWFFQILFLFLLGNPCFQWCCFYLIFFPSPLPAFLATLAFNDCVFSNFFPPPPSGQPMLSMIFFLSKVFLPFLATHAFNDFLFLKNFPPPFLGNPCFQWFPSPPPCLLGNPCFQWFCLAQLFPSPLLGNPCFQWFSLYQIFPPPFLATHAFNAFNDGLFIKYFPPRFVLASHALNDLPSSPCPRLVFKTPVLNDFIFMNFSFPPSWQPMLSLIFFLSTFSPFLGNPCFQWCCFYLIFSPFVPRPSWQPILSMSSFYQNFSRPPPPSWQPLLSMIFFLWNFFPPPPSWQPMLSMMSFSTPLPSWQPMLSMILFGSIFPPPFLATLAFNDCVFSNVSPPLSGQRMLSMIFFLSKISPPLSWQPMLSMLSMIFFLLIFFPCFENLCSQWFSFCEFFLPPFLATLAFNHFLFIKIFSLLGISCFQWCCFYLIFSPFVPRPSWQPILSMSSFYQNFPPPPPFLATLAFNDFLFMKFFSPPPLSWQPMLSMMSFSTPLPSWQPMLSMILFGSIFPPPFLATLAFNDCVFSNVSPPFLGNACFQWFSFYQNFPPPFLGNPCFQCFQWFSFY